MHVASLIVAGRGDTVSSSAVILATESPGNTWAKPGEDNRIATARR